MSKSLEKDALDYHRYPRPGKIEVIPTKPSATPADLSLAYSPGVAYPCLEIKDNRRKIFDYTNKGNLVAVISNGTAVLGLGDIGASAAKPVMEGKALLFKIFAGIDAFDIEVDEKDPGLFIDTVRRLAPTFGGINLEDIKAPECFEIESRLRGELDIPVMHDDQHGTAIISGAALLNAALLQGKELPEMKIVVNGAGAAAVACTRLYLELGVRKENVVMCDSKGVVRADRPGLSDVKKEFATARDLHTLADAMRGADMFLGLSKGDVISEDMLRSMAPDPIVFALANPDPEIAYEKAMESRHDLVFATGRSDYPNQINNVLGFPYIFRGALDCGAREINEAMKVSAAKAIAALARESVPERIKMAYKSPDLEFGKEYILPKPFDRRLLTVVAPAVILAAEESGTASRTISDMEGYRKELEEIICSNDSIIEYLIHAHLNCCDRAFSHP